MIVLNNLFPVFAMIVLGAIFKRRGLTHDAFLKTSDRLVYYVFFPALLFWKIGGNHSGVGLELKFCIAVIGAVIAAFMLSLICIKMIPISNFQAGTFAQTCYRFNTYIGMAVVLNAIGDDGVRRFSILVGFIIPLINVMAVSTLIWYSENASSYQNRYRVVAQSIITNPLIIACISGMVYSRFIHSFPEFVHNTFRLATSVTLPLALFSIGGALDFGKIKDHFRLSAAASAIKLVIFPAIGYALLNLIQVDVISLKTGMIFFALPTSPAAYVLSSQLNSDTELTSASIAFSTMMSFVSLSIVLLI